MEYTTTGDNVVFNASLGSLSTKTGSANSGFLIGTEGVAPGNFVPRFDMNAA
jgi:hypothetical protein